MAVAIILPLLLFLHLTSSLAETLTDPLDRQEDQLRRLEVLIESLSKTVSVLESSVSSLSSSPRFVHPTSPPSLSEPSVVGTVAKPKSAWSERFQFLAAARLGSEATCAAVLPYQELDGVSKYVAVGDNGGHVHVFTSAGDVLIKLPSHSVSLVTSILSYLSFRRNESIILTGHADGSIAAHRLSETVSNGDDWVTLSLSSSRPFALGSRDLDSPPVLALEVHQVGRIRYVLAADGGGRIRVFTESGTLYGTAIASSRPLAFMRQKLLFLTETGAGSLDLRSMSVKEIECDGLNGSLAKSYSFDGFERSKAYGFTSTGDLIHVVLLGDATNLKCRVRAIRKAEIDGPVSIQTIKGYLLAVNQEKVLVYNVSSQYYGRVGAPRPLFSAGIQEIKSLFSNSDLSTDGFVPEKPLIATDRDRLVILGLQGGYIGIYRSNFPVFKAESNAVVWSAPVFLFILFLIGSWQFYVKKKDSLGWAGEETFDNATGTATVSILGPGSSERTFGDGSRATDLRERRGSGLRGPARRYASPQRYTAGAGVSFRPGSADPGFRGPTDLNYRGQNTEAPGFPKRREPLFQNTQVVGENID
ncbi:uncharacterized membrane protein At1g75140-like [Dendrobium catenatum]|uniref:Putative membrane protein n=1 Tax=Dendrobium catenatum TaxID=906689 RepID=A0A2I0X8C8_9ASPA|nr:uncharacterized membrane protein At1g75140-like [Dendrobium catenatum]PKU84164.1 putative membrane protein [Dendrobium catenatum]